MSFIGFGVGGYWGLVCVVIRVWWCVVNGVWCVWLLVCCVWLLRFGVGG